MGRKIVMGQNPRMSLGPGASRPPTAGNRASGKFPDDVPTPSAHPIPSAAAASAGGVGCFGSRSPVARMEDACARRDWRSAVSLAKRHGVRVLAVRVGDDGWTPLHMAAVLDEKDAAAVFLAKGADPNAEDFDRQTPLHATVDATIAQMLADKGADVDAKDRSGFSPLHVAAADGRDAIARLLLARGADANAVDNNGRSPLHEAATGGHFEVAELLFDAGASVDPRDDAMAWTPLHLAAQHEYEHILALLILKGADINAWDSSGYTAMHMAAMGESKEVAQALAEAKADGRVKNMHGQTARDIAMAKGVPHMVEIFRNVGA